MIALATNDQTLIRWLPTDKNATYGFHKLFGFLSEEAGKKREGIRKRAGFEPTQNPWLCQFRLSQENGKVQVTALTDCKAETLSDKWLLSTPVGQFQLIENASTEGLRLGLPEAATEKTPRAVLAMLLSVTLSFFALPFLNLRDSTALVDKPLDPLLIRRAEERQKAVAIPPIKTKVAEAPKLASKVKNNEKPGGTAVAQNLGFLSLLGKKDLRKALGGVPSQLKEVTDGAGKGGKGGSGGELLVGLGQGVKETIVGNTGVKGLGGLGNAAGAGGGTGGYGTSLIGSGGTGNALNGIGNGRVLSNVALSNDVILEGGLDESVIQATIAKYLSQIRACYEQGLRSQPGITGQVTMAFEIAGSGKLNFARVARTSLGHPGVEGCISNSMMTWQFPKPVGGVLVKVSYPFLLRPTHS